MNTYMETPRLILRDWKEEDIPVFAELNSNDQVMEFFLKKLSYQETLDFYNRIRSMESGICYRSGFSLSGICKKDIGTERIIFFHLTPKQTFGTRDAKNRYGKKQRV